MSNLFFSVILVYLLGTGLLLPFVAAMTYIWIDLAKPQALAWTGIATLPLSMIAAALTVLAWTLNGERRSFVITPLGWMLLLFAAWFTLTTWHADPGLDAWGKWNWVIKVILFTLFIPMLFRSRLQIEALVLTVVLSLAPILFSAGVKTLLGGGGYGSLAVMGGGNNTGIAESSTLATVAVMVLPLAHWLFRHSTIFKGNLIFKGLLLVIAFSAFATIVGTTARTGLIAMAFLLASYALISRQRLRLIAVLLLGAFAVMQVDIENTSWGQRMSTISTYNTDSSAAGRVKVWEWTLDMVEEHPMGAGFNAYRLNNIDTVDPDGRVVMYEAGSYQGKAFHSIYFEVLGEHGYIGLFLYLSIFAVMAARLLVLRVRARGQAELEWLRDLCLRLLLAQGVLMVGGVFIGIAYQPYMFYAAALTMCLGRWMKSATAPLPSALRHASAV